MNNQMLALDIQDFKHPTNDDNEAINDVIAKPTTFQSQSSHEKVMSTQLKERAIEVNGMADQSDTDMKRSSSRKVIERFVSKIIRKKESRHLLMASPYLTQERRLAIFSKVSDLNLTRDIFPLYNKIDTERFGLKRVTLSKKYKLLFKTGYRNTKNLPSWECKSRAGTEEKAREITMSICKHNVRHVILPKRSFFTTQMTGAMTDGQNKGSEISEYLIEEYIDNTIKENEVFKYYEKNPEAFRLAAYDMMSISTDIYFLDLFSCSYQKYIYHKQIQYYMDSGIDLSTNSWEKLKGTVDLPIRRDNLLFKKTKKDPDNFSAVLVDIDDVISTKGLSVFELIEVEGCRPEIVSYTDMFIIFYRHSETLFRSVSDKGIILSDQEKKYLQFVSDLSKKLCDN